MSSATGRRRYRWLGLLLLPLLALLFIMHTPLGCELVGGRYGDRCVLPNCDTMGGCGHWAVPKIPCNALALQTEKSRVHFLFGDPDFVRGDVDYWEFGKVPSFPEVSYSGGRVSSVKCVNRF